MGIVECARRQPVQPFSSGREGFRKTHCRHGLICPRTLFRYLVPVMALLITVFSGMVRAETDLRRSPVVRAVESVGPAVVNIGTVIRERVGPGFPFTGDDFFRDFFPVRLQDNPFGVHSRYPNRPPTVS